MVQAVEAFHRATHQGTYLPPSKYAMLADKLCAAIPATIPQKEGSTDSPEQIPQSLKQSLKSRLRYGNEFSLRKRMEDIFASISADLLAELRINVPEFISQTVDARNFLTHYSDELEDNARSGTELWELSKRLEVLVAILLLRTLGIADAKIKQMVNRKYGYVLGTLNVI
jgi:hypothetical protein